jgi:hypothetical protein
MLSREVQTAALRLAKEVVRDSLRACKVRLSTVKSSDITKTALTLSRKPEYVKEAESQLEREIQLKLDLPKPEQLPQPDPKLLAISDKRRTKMTRGTNAKASHNRSKPK